jgi:hypothetical protein
MVISLADLHFGGTRLEWDEVVAIAQALCRVFVKAVEAGQIVAAPRGPDPSATLGLKDVFIDTAGRVSVSARGPHSVTAAIHCVGKVLSEMSPPTDPLFFRTRVVAKAISTPPAYESVEELSRALAAYQPDDPAPLIQTVFERSQQGRVTRTLSPPPPVLPPLPVSPPLPPAIRPATLSPPDAQPTRSAIMMLAARARSVDFRFVAAGMIVIAAVTGITALIASVRHPQVVVTNAAQPVARTAVDSVATAADIALPDSAPSNRAAGSVPTVVSSSAVKSRRASDPLATRSDGRRPSEPAQSVKDPEPDTLALDRRDAGVTLAGASKAPQVSDIAALSPNDGGSGRDARRAKNITYNVDSSDVIPPEFIDSYLIGILSPTSPGVRHEAVMISLVVNEHGRVDSVRAVNAPRNISESIVLTAALSTVKAWRFRPATKDGVPVRYVQVVPLSLVTGADPGRRPEASPPVQANQP